VGILPSEAIASRVDCRLHSIAFTAVDQGRTVVLPIGIDDQARSKKVRRGLQLSYVFPLDQRTRSFLMRRFSIKSDLGPLTVLIDPCIHSDIKDYTSALRDRWPSLAEN